MDEFHHHLFATMLLGFAAMLAYVGFEAFRVGNLGSATLGGTMATAIAYVTFIDWREKIAGR